MKYFFPAAAAASFCGILFFSAHALCQAPQPSPAVIRPGDVWPDNRGRHIQAHGGGVLKYGDTYYWFGEDRGQGLDPAKRYVSCYASKDLVHWAFRNQVIQLADPENFGPHWVLERPKVFYNAKTKRFVMYMHVDGPVNGRRYGLARVGVAVSGTVDGNYRYLRSFRPLDHESRDIGQFVDDDGTAYLIFEDRPFGFRIARLSGDVVDQAVLAPELIRWGERRNVQLRWEIYNTFNHTQFSALSTQAKFASATDWTQTDPLFLQPTSARPPRRMQLALRLYF